MTESMDESYSSSHADHKTKAKAAVLLLRSNWDDLFLYGLLRANAAE